MIFSFDESSQRTLAGAQLLAMFGTSNADTNWYRAPVYVDFLLRELLVTKTFHFALTLVP